MKTQQYQLVTIESFYGRIERVVVEDLGNILRVCRIEELKSASLVGRLPATIGFNKVDVVSPGS